MEKSMPGSPASHSPNSGRNSRKNSVGKSGMDKKSACSKESNYLETFSEHLSTGLKPIAKRSLQERAFKNSEKKEEMLDMI
jgi:hypothetical protein